MYMIKYKPLICCLLISLSSGGISTLITGKSTDIYKTLNLPPLAPPNIVFPIVWTVLFILMGISSYLIYISHSDKKTALTIYGIQLFLNMLWSPLFFKLRLFGFAFIWLILLWAFIILTILLFYKINKTAAYLLLPYLLWVTFAGYLNLSIYLLN